MMAEFWEIDWKKNVRDALNNWQRLDKLSQNPLTELDIVSRQLETSSYVNDSNKRALALREVMRAAIAMIGVEGEEPPDQDDPRWLDVAWRPYLIVTLLQRHKTATVADMLLMAGGNYFAVQGESIQLLADVLRDLAGDPFTGASTLSLSYPSGAVKSTDRFYINRKCDTEIMSALAGPDMTITIRGARQMGKTSLLIRGINEARKKYKARVVYFDLQGVDETALSSLDAFLRTIAYWIFDKLDLDLDLVDKAWRSQLPATRKIEKLIERYALSDEAGPVLLAMDEIDRLQFTSFHTDFFGLIRSWHNLRADIGLWDKLNVIMAISTEPYLLIADFNQSPFNVGQTIYLNDFDVTQVAELSRRYRSPLKDAELPELMGLLNGQPYLTRVAFYTMVMNKQEWREFSSNVASDEGPFRQHLQHQYRLLIQDPVLQEAMTEVIHGMHCSDEKAGIRLMRAGLVIQKGNKYDCRCDLYRRYFADKLRK